MNTDTVIADYEGWAVVEQYGSSHGQRVKTGLHTVTFKDTYVGYYQLKPGYPIFIIRRPRGLSQSNQNDLAHLIKAIDDAHGIEGERELMFVTGVRPSDNEKVKTPKQSRIVLPES